LDPEPPPLLLLLSLLAGLLAAGGDEELGEGLWLEEGAGAGLEEGAGAGVEEAGGSSCFTELEDGAGGVDELPPLGLQRDDVSRFLLTMLS